MSRKTFGEGAVASGDEERGGARPIVPARGFRQTVERLGGGPDGPELRLRHLHHGRPARRVGDRAGGDLVQSGVLDAALRLPAGPVGGLVDAGAAAAVLGLVDLAVDEALQRDEQHAEEDGEEGDAHVRLQVPLLEAEVLAEEGVGLRREAGGAPGAGRRVHCRIWRGEEEAELPSRSSLVVFLDFL